MSANRQEDHSGRESDRREHDENLEVQRNKQSEPGGQYGNQVDDTMDPDNLQSGGSRGPSSENTNS